MGKMGLGLKLLEEVWGVVFYGMLSEFSPNLFSSSTLHPPPHFYCTMSHAPRQITHGKPELTKTRCYAELFTTSPFTHMIFVDQSPLQNSTLDGWDSRFCNRGMNSAASLAALQATLALSPETAHKGTIAACLSYRAYPHDTDVVKAGSKEANDDEAFFLAEAMKGDPTWCGKLMADHTSLDWRESIRANFGVESGSETKALGMNCIS